MVDHIKDLFHLVKNHLDDRLKELEKRKKKSSTKTSNEDDAHPLNNNISRISSSASSCSSSDPICAFSLNRNNKKPQHYPPAATAAAEGKKRRYIYAPSTIEILEASSTPMSMSLYSSMKLPTGCLAEHDGCDDAELVARAMRCQEILKLSQQVKCKRAEDEAAKTKAKKEDSPMTEKKERDNT